MILTSSATCVTIYIGSITGYTQLVPCHLASLYITACNDVPGRVEWTCEGAVQKSRNKLKGCYQL